MNLSSPNRMIWEYFDALRRLVLRVCELDNDSCRKQDIALSVFVAVTVVESFLNVFFRVAVSEATHTHHEQRVLEDLAKRCTLDHKVRTWPAEVFGQKIDFACGIGKDFLVLKDKRNALMHFTSSHSTIEFGGVAVQGLADTSVFDQLSSRDAEHALATAEGMVELILRISGATAKELPWGMQLWTGKVAT
jgi:HEPN domain-containing protein